jgi:hypothetical protein
MYAMRMISDGFRILCQGIGRGDKRYGKILIIVNANLGNQDEIAKDAKNHGSTFCAAFLGSDKTTVSVGTGHNEYRPL